MKDIYENNVIKDIQLYIMKEFNCSEESADVDCQGFAMHLDIANELHKAIKDGNALDGLKIEGFTAKDLYENNPLSLVGAYNYLIYLREEPEEALAYLKQGLKRK